MKITEFRVQNYRSILDSGWIDIKNFLVIVGKNEAGKTSFLKALWKFNPHQDESYDLRRDWPRESKAPRKDTEVVTTVRFSFSSLEKRKVLSILSTKEELTGVEISRNYKGDYSFDFLPNNPILIPYEEKIRSNIENSLLGRISTLPPGIDEQLKSRITDPINDLIKRVNRSEIQEFENIILQFKEDFKLVQGSIKDVEVRKVLRLVDHSLTIALRNLGASVSNDPLEDAQKYIHSLMPTFVYMDEYNIFRGSAQLDQLQKRVQAKQLTDEDKTILMILQMAGLDLDEEVEKGNQVDKSQRILDINEASRYLTDRIAHRWTQKKYEIVLQVDGQYFMILIKDVESRTFIPLEERSKGFQWFFSFDMNFAYEAKEAAKRTKKILLLDEPGLHLHAAAQKDLLGRIKAYARSNQLIYTTHLPFMIDLASLEKIYIAEEQSKEGIKIHRDWSLASMDSRFTLQAALGISWSNSLLFGQYNLVVEGVTDFWYLSTLSAMFQSADREGLDEELTITPAGGGTKAAYLTTVLCGQELNVMVLLDSDDEGEAAYKQIVHQWILKDKYVLRIGEILGVTHFCAIEDLFDEAYYLEHVDAAYRKELSGKQKLSLNNTSSNKPIVERVEEALQAQGITHFNKGRVGKRIMEDLKSKKLEELSGAMVTNFEKVIAAINNNLKEWKGNSQN